PELEIIAPIREWGFTREEEIDYAEKYGIPVPVTKKSPYSIDENIWGRSIESGILEDPKVEPPEEPFVWTRSPMDAPNEPEYVEIGFERGIPVSLNGTGLPLIEIITALNSLAGLHGIGRVDMIEDRLVGIKSREVYEVPAAILIIFAHKELEYMVMERNLLFLKSHLESEYSRLIYDGLWFSHMREALEAFFDATQEVVNGTIRLKLYKGNMIISQRNSSFSLYERALATYEKGDIFDQKKAEGFIYVWGLPLSSSARKRGKKP
ncbi:MAG TPA: argininosuccinate synthase, partial [bacterium]|nr:argininosuccinate synthase [bacterium]